MVEGKAWKLFLQGTIDSQSPQRLADQLSRNQVQHGQAYLDSPGGSLKAGIEIGQLLRKHGLSTYVRKQIGDRDVPGQCLSACAYAFVGGYFRYLGKDDVLGIHRFSSKAPTSRDVEYSQIMSAAITTHLGEMGIDARFFQLATQIDSEQIYRLSIPEAIELRVANNGKLPAKWSIEVLKEGLYLRGTQKAWHGTGKVVFACRGSTVVFYPFYGPVSNSEMITSATVKHSLRVGQDLIEIGRPTRPLRATNGVVSAPFDLSPSQVERIRSASSVGYAAQPGNPDVFWGFTVDIGKNRAKVNNFLTQCGARAKQ